MCRCGIVGDPIVVFYDEGGVGLLLDSNNFLMSYASYDESLYPCNFVIIARTHKPQNNTQLLVLEGMQLVLNQDISSTTFFTEYGIWNSLVTDFWIQDPDNYTDSNIKITSDGDGGYFLDPTLEGCNIRFYAKVDGIYSKMAIYVNKDQYSGHVNGLCGNCNGILDEYDDLPDGNSIEAPMRIVDNVLVPSTNFPPSPIH